MGLNYQMNEYPEIIDENYKIVDTFISLDVKTDILCYIDL